MAGIKLESTVTRKAGSALLECQPPHVLLWAVPASSATRHVHSGRMGVSSALGTAATRSKTAVCRLQCAAAPSMNMQSNQRGVRKHCVCIDPPAASPGRPPAASPAHCKTNSNFHGRDGVVRRKKIGIILSSKRLGSLHQWCSCSDAQLVHSRWVA